MCYKLRYGMKWGKLMPTRKRPLIRPHEAGDLDPERIRAVVRAVHVLPATNGWQVKKGGKERVDRVFVTRDEAEQFAHELSVAHNVEIMFHSKSHQELHNQFSFKL
jgi:Uncharacterized protein conserved in bacteria (DUF2188)